MKNTIIYIFVLFLALTACNNDDDTPARDMSPVVMSVAPVQGSPNDVIVIYGKNFSTSRTGNKVTIGNMPATVLEASENRLEVVVPEGQGKQEVKVETGGAPVSGDFPFFSYAVPQDIYIVSTLAGNLEYGLVDGPPGTGRFRGPEGVTIAPDGSIVVTDRTNNAIRRLTPDGLVSTITGNGTKGYQNGQASQALLNYPWKSCVDSEGNIYIAERDNHVIRKIDINGIVSTIAGNGSRGFKDGAALEAQFNQPLDIAVDNDRNLYIADNLNHRIRKLTPDGQVTTIAGSVSGFKDGNGSEALFTNPSGLCTDAEGNVFVADRFNHRIRKINTEGQVSTVAGSGSTGATDGESPDAEFNNPYGVDINTDGDIVVADLSNHKIRLISGGKVTTVAGTSSGFLNGTGNAAQFYNPSDVTFAGDIIYVADLGNNMVRKIVKKQE